MKVFIPQAVLAVAAAAWLALVLVAPYAAEGSGAAISTAVYALGSAVCHQRPERSFFLHGVQLPVCARCAGLYAGAAMAAVLAAFVRPRQLSSHEARQILAFTAVPAAATLVFEWMTGTMPSNGVRGATGVVLGAAIGWVVSAVMKPAHQSVELH